MKMKAILFALLIFGSIAFAAVTGTTDSSLGKISGVISNIYCTLESLLPVVAITLVILAGVAYGIGNFFGAETKAKAQGWGMAALTGAIIMLIISLIGPVIVKALYGEFVITCTV